VSEIQGEGVYYLDARYYSPEFGLSTEPVGKFENIIL
jgi:CRISPR-associated endonuclease/helicase Cas3